MTGVGSIALDGRVRGSAGAAAGARCSGSGLLSLLGGVPNGEDLSLKERGGVGSSLGASTRADRDTGLLLILGFSDLLTSGGIPLNDISRLSSPDLRGGGGEGG